MEMPRILAPYAHELNRWGTGCAEDCPACRWAEEYEQILRLQIAATRSIEQAGLVAKVGAS